MSCAAAPAPNILPIEPIMRALITRPKEDSTAIAERLEEFGIEPVIEPLMTVEPVADVELDLDGVQAILLTSRNGARALADATGRRDIAVYAVGHSTAELAREKGFKSVESAGGDSESLAELVRQRVTPEDGTLLHAAGAAVAGDLAGTLTGDGYDVRRQELYTTRPSAALSVSTCGMLSDGSIGLVLFFSPRTAQTFVDLVGQAGLTDACANITAVCLSRAVALTIGSLEWREVHISGRPNLRSMIEVVASAGSGTEQTQEESQGDSNSGSATSPSLSSMSTAPETKQPWGAGAPPARPKRRSGAWTAGIVALVVIAGAGIYAWPMVAARIGTQPIATGVPNATGAAHGAVAAKRSALRDMAGRVGELDAALKALQSGPIARLETASGEVAAELPRIATRLDAAEKALAAGISGAGSGNSAAADARIEALEKTIGDLRSVVTSRIDGLDTRLSGLASGAADGMTGTARLRAENDRLKTGLAAMTLRLETLEAAASKPAPKTEPLKGSALVLAVGQLREALGRSGPFPETLDSLRAVGGGDPVVESALQVLAPLAETGVATKNRLTATFDVAAAGAVRAALAPAGSGWIDRTVQRLASVVTIRREGADVDGDSAQAVLARAEARLAAGDLEGADEALAGLTAEPADAMAAWRKAVASRIAADGAIDKLGRHAIQLLSGKSS